MGGRGGVGRCNWAPGQARSTLGCLLICWPGLCSGLEPEPIGPSTDLRQPIAHGFRHSLGLFPWDEVTSICHADDCQIGDVRVEAV